MLQKCVYKMLDIINFHWNKSISGILSFLARVFDELRIFIRIKLLKVGFNFKNRCIEGYKLQHSNYFSEINLKIYFFYEKTRYC